MSLKRRSTVQDELLPNSRQNLGTPPPRRRRRREPLIHPRKLLRVFALLGLAVLAAYGALTAMVSGEGLRPKMEAEISAATGRHVTIRSLSFSVRHLALVATDLAVGDDPASGGAVPFVQARTTVFHVRLIPLLFAHNVQITGVSIDNPLVLLRQDAAGNWNYYSLLRASTRSITELDPPAIEVTNGRVSITDFGDDGHSVRLRNVRLTSPALSLQMNNPVVLTGEFEGGGTVKLDGRAGPIEWDQTGPLVPLSGLIHAEKIKLGPSNLFSSAGSIDGQLSVDGSIESDGRMMRIDGQAKAAKLKLAASGKPAAETLQAVFTVAHDLNAHAGVVNRCDFRVNKGAVTLTGKYASGGSSPLLDLQLVISDAAGTDLAPFLPALGFVLPGSAGLVGGSVTGNLKVDGGLSGPYLTGSLAADGTRLMNFDLSQRLTKVEGLDASDLNSEIEIVSYKTDLKTGNNGLGLENLEVAVAGLGALSGNGWIAPDGRIDFQMSGIRGLTGPKGLSIPFTVRGTTADPVFRPGK